MISERAKRTIEYLSENKLPDLHKLPVSVLREGMNAQAALIEPPQGCIFEPVDAGGVPCVWVKAAETKEAYTIIYLHGGGYILGSHQTHRGLLGSLSQRSGIRVLAVDYRLAPENPYPAALEDAITVYRWLLEQKLSPAHIAIGGDSAGGGLTLATLLKLKTRGESLPAVAFCLSPWVDLECTGETIETKKEHDPLVTKELLCLFAALYAGQASMRTPFISPLYGDLTGLPPTLIVVGTAELLLSDSQRMADALKRAGVSCTLLQWDEMFHVFPLSTFLPESKKALEKLAVFLSSHLRATRVANG
ncbi:MAG: alpha/beta hydrolase [Deltaproteobacteria bacterium]|nr:alpha/beta hydrolase [Deltaproteobacteria bacterium]